MYEEIKEAYMEEAKKALAVMKDMEKERNTPYESVEGNRVIKCSSKEKLERYKKHLNIKK